MSNKEIFDLMRKYKWPEGAVKEARSVWGKAHYIPRQYLEQALNEIAGPDGWRVVPLNRFHEVVTQKTSSGERRMNSVTLEAVLQLGQWKDGVWVAQAEAYDCGGFAMPTLFDAHKAALSDFMQRACAKFGLGAEIFFDEDPRANPERGADTREPEPEASANGGGQPSRRDEEMANLAQVAKRAWPSEDSKGRAGKAKQFYHDVFGADKSITDMTIGELRSLADEIDKVLISGKEKA